MILNRNWNMEQSVQIAKMNAKLLQVFKGASSSLVQQAPCGSVWGG